MNRRKVMGSRLTFSHRNLVPHGHLPLPTLARGAGTTLCFAPKQSPIY